MTEDEIDKSIMKSVTELFGDDDEYVPVGIDREDIFLTVCEKKSAIAASVLLEFQSRKTHDTVRFLTNIMIPLEE